LVAKLKDYNLPDKEFFVLKPKRKWTECMDNETKRFWCFKKISGIYVSIPGPGSQQVANQWNSANDYWFMMLTQQGYIVV
jgi:dipeptidyl-peptidase-4